MAAMSSSTIHSTATEFLYFRLQPSVRPEDAANGKVNDEGERFLNMLRGTASRSGHMASSWGRTEEDENDVVWVIEWTDSSHSVSVDCLKPFLDPSSPQVITFFANLNPPPMTTSGTFADNPVTELVAFAVRSDISPDDQRQWDNDTIALRSALMEKIPQKDLRPLTWSTGCVARPVNFDHPRSPSGKAIVYILAVGWESKEKHLAARETPEFAETIQPLREKMLPPVKGLEMRHVRFRKVR